MVGVVVEVAAAVRRHERVPRRVGAATGARRGRRPMNAGSVRGVRPLGDRNGGGRARGSDCTAGRRRAAAGRQRARQLRDSPLSERPAHPRGPQCCQPRRPAAPAPRAGESPARAASRLLAPRASPWRGTSARPQAAAGSACTSERCRVGAGSLDQRAAAPFDTRRGRARRNTLISRAQSAGVRG